MKNRNYTHPAPSRVGCVPQRWRALCTVLVACAVGLGACDDFLDITPEGQVKRDVLLQSQQGIESALYGVYAQMRSTSLYGQQLSFDALGIMDQTFYSYGATTITHLSEYDYDYSGVESIFDAVWTDMYANISNVNSILDCDLVAGASHYPYTLYRAEALALRAFMHFDLLRLYAPQYTLLPEAEGIPYAKDFSLFTPDFESLADNYAHILADLTEAEALLTVTEAEPVAEATGFGADRETHMNLHAVRATLARVCLTMGNRDAALRWAQKVIDESPCTLKNPDEVDKDVAGVLSTKETLFGLYAPDFYDIVYAKLYQTTSFYSLDCRTDLVDRYGDENYRPQANFSYVEVGGEQQLRFTKILDKYELEGRTSARSSERILGINLIRLPEMYYICAECLLDDDYPRAVEYFNEVLTHRGVQPLDASSQERELTLDVITEERYKELVGEGQTFYHLKRLNLPITSYDGNTVWQPANSIYVVPIPDSEYENRY